VIYSNSVFGARSNFEGGPSALAAALTGRTPRYGYHLDAHRRATRRFQLDVRPRDLSEWGALGGIVGRECGSYWEVPLIDGIENAPGSDALKHFGAAMASYGSTALFHTPGITAEADGMDRRRPAGMPAGGRRSRTISRAEIDAFTAAYGATGDTVDVVVFAAPQLSLVEMAAVADALSGRQVHADTTLLVATSPEIKHAADRMGLTGRIEAAGAIVAAGICFYQSYAGELAEANGWKRLLTNSAKLVNIIGGYGYRPTLLSLERCIDSAVSGRVV
jgi:predicted aconitase